MRLCGTPCRRRCIDSWLSKRNAAVAMPPARPFSAWSPRRCREAAESAGRAPP